MPSAATRFAAPIFFLAVVVLWMLAAGPAAAAEEDPSGVGVVDTTSGLWWLRDPSTGATTSFYYGNPDDFPIMGDWDCDGVDTPGLYRQSDGFVYLRNANSQGNADVRFFFGDPGDVPLAGDFNDDGCDTVSIYRPSQARFYIINDLGSSDDGLGAADIDYLFGDRGDQPFAGDFNGDGTTTVGLHRESTGLVYYLNSHRTGAADDSFIFGDPGDRLIAGDWLGGGADSPGVLRPSQGKMFLIYTNTPGAADDEFLYGAFRMVPVAGTFGPLPGGDPAPPRDEFLAGSFTTFHSCCQNRVTNIHIIADAADGVVVLPGETFSLNDRAGIRTTAKGYLRAGAIIGGELYCCDHPLNVGGGVSQFATTLYNAVFFAGYDEVSHRPHSIWFSRYPMGREATLLHPFPDVIFRNDTVDPVRIETSYTSTSVTVRLYGNNERRVVSAGLSGNATTADGGRVRVTRIIRYANGTSSTESWSHTYRGIPREDQVSEPPSGGGGSGGGGSGGGGGGGGGGPNPI